MRTLEELKNDKDGLRSILLEMYMNADFDSVRSMSIEIGIPYTSFRSYMLGKGLSDKNLLKIKKWVDTII